MGVKMKNSILSFLSVFTLFSVVTSIFLTSQIANHIAPFAEVSVSSTCNSNRGGITCNTTCPSRTHFPSISNAPLISNKPHCNHATTVDGLPAFVNKSHGNIDFKRGSNCTSVNTTVDLRTSGRFTLSTWLQVSSSFAGQLFSIGDMLKIAVDNNALSVNGKPKIGTLEVDKWINLVIRHNGNVDVFISGQRTNYTESLTVSGTRYPLVVGPSEDLDASERLDMADVRWYPDVLTDREIESLVTGTLRRLKFDSQCRCPDTHPTLYTTDGGRPQHDLSCANRAGDVVPRLNADAHPHAYMIDEDISTFWASNFFPWASIDITLAKKVQMKSIVLRGLQTDRDLLKVSLNGKEFVLKHSGSAATIDFEEEFSPVENRTTYEMLVGNKINILFEHSNKTVFTVSEIELHARCPCYGNDPSCVISSSAVDYTCNCSVSSNTSGTYCDTCRDEFYKLSEDQTCQYPCDCHSFGSTNNICSKVGGQCYCKSNVDNTTRACDRCKFNTVNITSDDVSGCTACACNPDGITECMGVLSCHCKANVESRSGTCSKCRPNYYGITNTNGCLPCGCDDVGTNETEPRTCDMTTGLCTCKSNVQGRTCNECKDEFFNLHKSQPFGCEGCNCNGIGRLDNTCDKISGQCRCRQPVTDNRACKPAKLQLKPDYGPIAGGTSISITGELLGDQSVSVILYLVDVLELEKYDMSRLVTKPTNNRNDSVIISRTKRHVVAGEVPVTITWTKSGKTFKNKSMKFTYKENPTVTPPDQTVKTFASGGCAIDVYGENLDNVPQPELLIYTENANFSTPCTHIDSSKITCQTPLVDAVGSSELEVSYGVGLDNIQNYTRFSSVLLIVPDPNATTSQLIEFRNTFDDTITIKGKDLNKACRDSDVRVLIGNVTCSLISRTDTDITCDPHEEFPGESREATIMLYIGNFKAEAGTVNFISFWKTTEFYIIVGCVSGGMLVIIIIIVTVCICRRRRKQTINDKRISGIEMTSDQDRPHHANAYVTMEPVTTKPNPVATVAPIQSPVNHSKAFIKRLPANVAKVVKTSVIDKQHIELGRLCTQKGGLIRIINGHFSSTSSSPFAGTALTIKTLIDSYDPEGTLPSWLTGGLLECTRLRDCYNENVLPLLGISIDDKHVYILYPEMSNRSLKEYMNSSSRNFNQEKRLDICKQVAEGMNFLDAEHIVHKDLATRNCWVESNGSVKIGDASFAWDLFPDDYLLQNDRYQPVRWMAPESLRQPGFYSSKTDVWSYGVLMWEVFTNGYLPYHDIEDDTQIKYYVCEKGYRLGKPHECSDIIYKVLEICHTENSQDRPNFFIVVNHLSEILTGGNPTIFNVDQETVEADEVDYMNYGQVKATRH